MVPSGEIKTRPWHWLKLYIKKYLRIAILVVLIIASKVSIFFKGPHKYFCGTRKEDTYICKYHTGHCEPRLDRRVHSMKLSTIAKMYIKRSQRLYKIMVLILTESYWLKLISLWGFSDVPWHLWLNKVLEWQLYSLQRKNKNKIFLKSHFNLTVSQT